MRRGVRRGCVRIGLRAEPADSVLTLAEANARALAGHPALAAVRAQLDAARARRADAGRLKNPVLTAEIENFGATSPRREATLRLGQTLELGGDRGARAGLAAAQLALVEADGGAERRRRLRPDGRALPRCWAAQERLLALRDAERLAAEAVRAADARHRAGAALVTERVRAEGQQALRTLERAKGEAQLALARMLLAAQWGDSVASFGRLDPGEVSTSVAAGGAGPASAARPCRRRTRAPGGPIARGACDARSRPRARIRHPPAERNGLDRLPRRRGAAPPLWNAQGSGVAAAEAEIAAARARAGSAERALRAEFESALAHLQASSAAREELTRVRTISADACARSPSPIAPAASRTPIWSMPSARCAKPTLRSPTPPSSSGAPASRSTA
jgi:cobalt-zinc-cadmium efflux system outer membrane protein